MGHHVVHNYGSVAGSNGNGAAVKGTALPDGQLESIIMSSMDAVIVIDSQQHIVLFNRAAEQMYGWSSAEIIGLPLDVIIPEPLQLAHRRHVERFGSTGATVRGIHRQLPITGLRKDNTESPIEASISRCGDGEQMIYGRCALKYGCQFHNRVL